MANELMSCLPRRPHGPRPTSRRHYFLPRTQKNRHRPMKTALPISSRSQFSFTCRCGNIRALQPGSQEKCRKPIWWGSPLLSPGAPPTHSVRCHRCYLDLFHQLHRPGHLDEDLLLEDKWAVELGSGQTRLPRMKRAGVREACLPTCTLAAPTPTSEPLGPDLSHIGQRLQILRMAAHRRHLE